MIDEFVEVEDVRLIDMDDFPTRDQTLQIGDDKMAYVESENFAIYSNIEFLYLIGKFAASSQ